MTEALISHRHSPTPTKRQSGFWRGNNMLIKVENELPKKFVNVLVFFPGKDYGSKIQISYNEGNGFADSFKWGKGTHWQHLPKQPK